MEEFKSQDPEFQLRPKGKLEIKESLLKTARRLRFDYIEEFPTERLLPGMPNYNLYKCRTNFFSSISVIIEGLRQVGLLKGVEAGKECDEFLKFCESLRGRKEFYKREDVDKGNRVLDFLIKELS